MRNLNRLLDLGEDWHGLIGLEMEDDLFKSKRRNTFEGSILDELCLLLNGRVSCAEPIFMINDMNELYELTLRFQSCGCKSLSASWWGRQRGNICHQQT